MYGLGFSRRMCYADLQGDELPKDGFAPRRGHAASSLDSWGQQRAGGKGRDGHE